MVEHRRFGNLLPHLVLLAGVAIVAFPVYLAIIASTHDNSVIANGQMPLIPGSHAIETYWNTIVSGTGRTTRQPVDVRIFPTYKITSDLHMLDSYAGLILPLIASATATLLFRQFFMTVPKEH